MLASFQSLVQASKALDSDEYFKYFNTEKFVGLNGNGTNWNSMNDFAPLITSGFTEIKEVTFLKIPNVKVSIID